MIKYELKKVTETQWFNLIKNTYELKTNEFIDKINNKSDLMFLIQCGNNNDIKIYGYIKNIGLYGFLMSKNDFFHFSKTDIILKNENEVMSFMINEKQTFNTFLEYFDLFLTIVNKQIMKPIKIYFYEEIYELLNIVKEND